MAETSDKPQFEVVREAVASFADKAQLRQAVAQLLAAGFGPADLSVLGTHESLEVAGDVPGYQGKPAQSLFAGLTDEASLIMPLTVAGISLLSGGPLGVALAALAGAGLGGVAIKELLDYATANRHSADFATALKAGEVLLWARVADPQLEPTAVRILEQAGGHNAHIHARALNPKR